MHKFKGRVLAEPTVTLGDVTAKSLVVSTSVVAAETDTGQRWVGGAVVYRKVLTVAAGPDQTTINVAHGITGLLDVVKVYGSLKNVGNDRIVFPTDGAQISMNIDQTNVELTSAADLSGYAGVLVLEYTKS
jgi:hypothetical protein